MKRIAALWGIGGVVLLLFYAVVRLYPKSLAAFDFSFSWYHWLAFAVNILFMAYSEGYKGFQVNFSPWHVQNTCRVTPSPTSLCLRLYFAWDFLMRPKGVE